MKIRLNEGYLREQFGISDDYSPERLNTVIAAASRRLRSWIGDTRYDETTDPDEAEILLTAEGCIGFHYLLTAANAFLTPQGVVIEAKVEGNTTHRYLTASMTAELSRQFLDQAEEMVRPWLLDDGTDVGIEISEIVPSSMF